MALRRSASKRRGVVETPFQLLGALSKPAERYVRRALRVFPELLECNRSPSGALLSTPIRMGILGGRDDIARIVYSHGWAFERPFPVLLEYTLRAVPEGLFLDIGANTGLYALLAKALRPSVEVHAFEPSPDIVKLLKSNVALNSGCENVTVVEEAVSDELGVAKLFIPTPEHGLVETSASLSSVFKQEHGEIQEVKTVTLDDYCRERGAVTLMKVDVEGVEDRVLKGAKALLRRDQPLIFCEVLAGADTWGSIEPILEEVGYSIASIEKDGPLIIGGSRKADNHIFFPRSGRAQVEDLARKGAVALVS
jgi:FkbM family methyltransferase